MSGKNDNNIDSEQEMDPVEENQEKLVSSIKEENPKSLLENNGSFEIGKMDPGLESKFKASAETTLVASEMNRKDLSSVKIIQEGSKLEENGEENGNKMEKNVKLGNIKEVDYEENDKIEETPSNGKGKNVENGGNGEDADEEEDDFDLFLEGDDDGTEEEQAAFMRELETFHREMRLEYKPPKFYGVGLNCLKLWRAVIRLGGYERVTACKLWRQVGESFNPPKTCTTISWSFRSFYEKALLEYEKHKILTGKLRLPIPSLQKPIAVEFGSPASGPGRARRDAAERAMQGWHSQKLLNNSDVGDPIIRREKYQKGIGTIKRKKTSGLDSVMKGSQKKALKPQVEAMVVDVGEPADWVKISVKKTKDCFEVYALVPGLLRDEVHVQSDPAGHLIISGEPDQPDNPWGVTPFKKVITLPSRVDPHQTSAVVTLHGQLFVRAPFEQSDP